MAAYVDQACYGWSHDELPRQDDSQEVSASQMLDHGSISFGRFAYESLSWEKRSVFTHNKCQEELEKFKFPGFVAKKKAYFEEYYKRIRAMKALQESQQTEITLDYGGDGSISSQTGEEDETTVQLENLGGEVADAGVVHPEEASVEVSMEKGNDCSKPFEVQIEHSDTKVMSPVTDSSGNNFDEHEQEDKTSYLYQTQHLDMDTSVHESLTISIEEPKHHDLEDHGDEGVSRENIISDTNIEPEVVSGERTSWPTNSKAADVELKPTSSTVPKKVGTFILKYKDNVSVTKLKEPRGPAKNCSKLELTAKPNIQKPTRGSKYPIQKTMVKSGSSVCSSKATADKVSRNNKSSSAASHGPLKEVHSNVTIPRPFSLATDKRAVTPGSRKGARKLISKPSNPKSPSAITVKEAINVQGTSKQTVIISSMKSRGLENKRGHEEKKKPVTLDRESTSHRVRGANVTTISMKSRGSEHKRGHEEKKKPVTLDNQSTRLSARGANVLGPGRARSLNLPPRNKFSSNSGTDGRINDSTRDDGHKEGRHDTRVAEFCRKVFTPPAAKLGTDTKAIAPPAAKLRTEIKKMAPSWMNNSSLSVRRPRFGEQSLDGKKPRQEKPRWR